MVSQLYLDCCIEVEVPHDALVRLALLAVVALVKNNERNASHLQQQGRISQSQFVHISVLPSNLTNQSWYDSSHLVEFERNMQSP